MNNFNIITRRKDSEEAEKMSRVNFLTKEQHKACMENGKMNKAMAQRLSDRNMMERYKYG